MEKDYSMEFRTRHLGLAAAILAAGYKLIDLDRSIRKDTVFIFKRERNIEGKIDKYFNRELELDALGYWNSIKILKDRIYMNDPKKVD